MSLAALGPAAAGLLASCVVGETAQQVSFKLGADRAGTLPGSVAIVGLAGGSGQ